MFILYTCKKLKENQWNYLKKTNEFCDIWLREGRNILQDIRSGEEQYFTGPNQNLPDRKV